MLYSLLRLIIGSGLRLHFQRIETSGLERLEQDAPTIIIANHTNALTDPLLLGVLLRRRIHFYVRGDVFEHPLARRLFTHLGMMPIFRLKDGREKLGHNERSNEQALKILASGGAILIFAEGSSDEHKVMRPAKKGPFRLAVEAAKALSQPPVIVPLGINYLEPEKPDTTAWLLTGGPIPWPEDWRQMPEAKLSLELMKAADKDFMPLTLHAGDEKRAEIAEPLLLLQKNNQQQLRSSGMHFNFHVAQVLLQRLAALPDESFFDLRNKVREWQQCSEELNLEEKAFKHFSEPARRGVWSGVLLGAPVWLAGLVFHWPAFAIAREIVRSKVKAKDFISSVHVLSVTFLNLIWYLLWLTVLWLAWNVTGAVLLLLAMAACGVITHTILLPNVRQCRYWLKIHQARKKRKESFKRLLSLRQALLDWLQSAD